MMAVMAAATFTPADLSGYPIPPAWRKATRNMIMATGSLERALERLSHLSDFSVDGREDVALILGSMSGELETTADFLVSWAQAKMARPVLFQNSLHNATTGFVSIQRKLIGPSFSVSSGLTTPQECLALAKGLLVERLSNICLVILVEGNLKMTELLQMQPTSEGAVALVLADFDPTLCGELSYVEGVAPLIDFQKSSLFLRAQEWSSSR